MFEVYCVNENNISCGLIALSKWSEKMGVTPTTTWRWRKAGVITTVNIHGRQYMTAEEVARFNQRVQAGEFAKKVNPAKRKLASGFQ